MTEHLDVLVVGAGLSGIGAACHLRGKLPHKSLAILEARDAVGGTWDLFRYPGIRSDSDMFTLGFRFRPWKDPRPLADGPAIREYIAATAREHRVDRLVRFGHRVVGAEWSSADGRWIVRVERSTGETLELTCGFLFWCSGYYRYDRGHTPEFEGMERFGGTVIHPQQWPEDFDPAGRRIVVIGSGATAVTLVPALAARAAHVTMLQRSPSYVLSLPGTDPVADVVRRILPERAAYAVVRWKNVLLSTFAFQMSRRRPGLVKRVLIGQAKAQLPRGYDVGRHFTPRYDPWDQRLCVVPRGDLFAAIGSGRASVVTDHIETFTQAGVRLASGEELGADVVITATGLEVQLLGGAEVVVDGRPVDLAGTIAYKGAMASGIPNTALALGYTNASWTLKCELISEWVCRVLAHMDEHGHAVVVAPDPGPDHERVPAFDLESGYVLRALDRIPKQGTRVPWRVHQNYVKDIRLFRHAPVADGVLRFSPCPSGPQPSSTAFSRARSLRFARRMAADITGAPTLEKPDGAPRLRRRITVPPPGASSNS